MIKISRALFWDMTFLMAGIMLALVLIPLATTGVKELRDMYDAQNPPTKFRVVEYTFGEDEVLRMRFEVERLKDCDLLRVAGFSRGDKNAPLEPAVTLRREDGSEPIPFPVGAVYVSPWWVMKPVRGHHVRLYGYYDCSNRLVRTKLIDEVLP